MKIAEVCSTFPPYNGGVGNVAFHNARLLAERGHEVTVVTRRPKAELAQADLPFTIHYLDPAFTLGNASLLPHLPGALRGFDLIHLHYPFIFGAELVVYAAKRYRIPVLMTYHNKLVEESRGKRELFAIYNHLIEPRVVKRASHTISVSRDHFASLFPGIPSTEVANGVDTTGFSPKSKAASRRLLGLPRTAPTALFVGGLDAAHKFKNVPSLLRAAASIDGLEVIIVGRGELRPALIALAQKLGLNARIHFDDACSTERLPLYYSAADVTVLPSNRTESFGMVLAESMACETPVIATDLPGVRSVVRHQHNGLLVPVNDDQALEEALRWMTTHHAERLAMGKAGRSHVERNYAWPVVGNRLELVCLQTVISGPYNRIPLMPSGTQRELS